MAISSGWQNPTLLLYEWTFETPWTWDDYSLQREMVYPIIREVDDVVDTLFDMRYSPQLPEGMLPIVSSTYVHNIGVTVIVSPRLVFHPFCKILRQVLLDDHHQQVFVVATMTEAHALIRTYRDSRQAQR